MKRNKEYEGELLSEYFKLGYKQRNHCSLPFRKKNMKLYPALAIDAEEEDAITQIGISDKFCIFSVIFFEELHEKAMMS
jgi:hypothetical protein